MANIKGVLTACPTTILVNPVVNGAADLKKKRFAIRPGVVVDITTDDGYYNIESNEGQFDTEMRMLAGSLTPDDLLSSGTGVSGGGFLRLGVTDPVPPGTPEGTLVIRVP